MIGVKERYYLFIPLLVSFLISLITGIIKFLKVYRLFITELMLPMNDISLVHDWSSLIMGVLTIIHLIVYWEWVVAATKKVFK